MNHFISTLGRFTFIILSISIILVFEKCNQQPVPPSTDILMVTDTLHSTIVEDPYRWLENWNDPEVQQWSERQNHYARNYLDKFPDREKVYQRIQSIQAFESPSYYNFYWVEDRLFAMKKQPPLNQPLLVYLSKIDDPETARTVLDLNSFDPEQRTSIDWYHPSPDGKIVGVSLSVAGSEEGDLHLFKTETGEQIGEIIPHVNGGTAGGDMAWLADGSGFYYTRYPRKDERPETERHFFQQVWFHKLGTSPDDDQYILGKDFERIAEIRLEIQYPSDLLLVTVQYGDGGTFAFYLVKKSGELRQIAKYEDEIVEARFGPKNKLYLLSLKNTPRGKLLELDLNYPSLKLARPFIPEKENTIISSFGQFSKIIPMENFMYVSYQLGGPSEIRCFNYKGEQQNAPVLLPISTVHEMVPLTKNRLLFSNSSYINPKIWYLYDPPGKQSEIYALSNKAPVDFSDCEVIREFATSKDGTQIPVNIIRKKDITLNGTNPTILYGYGGYGISQKPYYSAIYKLWIEQGGVYAIANLRGGGEYGEEWHKAGMLTNKQNVFDDFAAAMQYLIDKEYTRPEKLAIRGGSNGGLLMGAMITQHPDLFAATASTVGIYDMVRVELSPNGMFNIPEFGTVKNPEQFDALYAYSPYHRVKDGTAYPAILFMTGANDPRVDPMQSRKMTARLQEATSSHNPVLLRTSSRTGHGGGTPLIDKIEEYTDQYTFLFHFLGVKYVAIPSGNNR